MDSLYIIIPTYNEEQNIKAVIDEWYPVLEQCGDERSRLVLIDDESQDHTREIIRQCMQNRPKLILLTKPNSGHSSTVLYGYRYAAAQQADYIFQTDSDRQTLPQEFPHFWQLRTQFEAIIGIRSQRQDGPQRVFVQKVLLFLLWLFFGVRVPDANTPFRLMKTSLVEKYLNKLPEKSDLTNIMLTTYFAYFNEKLKFVPITFRPRQGGTNFMNMKRITRIGLKALVDFYYLRKHIRD